MAIDDKGNVLIAGSTRYLAGHNIGEAGAYVAKLDPAGNMLWIQQFGTEAFDVAHGVVATGQGDIYVAGNTNGSFGAPNLGDWDAFIGKLIDVPSGDYNGEGSVNAADYTVWRNGLGGLHTEGDYNVWTSHFGAVPPGIGAGSASDQPVPEPSTLALAALGLLGMFISARQRQLKIVSVAPTQEQLRPLLPQAWLAQNPQALRRWAR